MKNGSLADKIIIGFLLALGMAETGHLLAVFGHRPFSDAVLCFIAEAIVATAALIIGRIVGRKRADAAADTAGKRTGKRTGGRHNAADRKGSRRGRGSGVTGKDITPRIAGICIAFLLLVLFQVMTITSGEKLVRRGDQTIETVTGMLETDGVYTVNPLTGQAYTAGVPKRIQILGLPTFYGILCRLGGMITRDALRGCSLCARWIENWVPVAVLCLSYLAYWTVAKVLFPEKKDWDRRMLFLTVTAAVFCAGNYAFGLDGFGLLYCGYRGITIRNAVLVPYTVGLMLRNKWKTALVCVLAEACIVWTLYGLGACLAIVLGMTVVRRWIDKNRRTLNAVGEEV